MNISKLATPEALEAVAAMETVEELRQAATDLGISFSGNTGAGTLRKKIEDFFAEEPVIDFTKDEDKEDEEEEMNYSFALPGNSSFVGDRPWETKMGGIENVDEETMDEDGERVSG